MIRMSPEEFKETGLLEQYVLGLLSDEESTDVANFIAKHPSIRKLYEEQQDAVWNMANMNSIDPPKGTKGELIDAISSSAVGGGNPSSLWIRNLLIATALVMTGIAVFSLLKWKSSNESLKAANTSYRQLALDCNAQKNEAEKQKKLFAFYDDFQTNSTVLTGNEKAPNFEVITRYNKKAQTMNYKVISPIHLKGDQVLCLWGDKDGEMILVAKMDGRNDDQLIPFDGEMVSFNITIENDVPNIDHPDVSQLIASVAI